MQKKLGIVVVAALPAAAKAIKTPRPGVRSPSSRSAKVWQAKAA